MRKLCLILAVILAIVTGANGAAMLFDPAGWFFAVPGVTSTGGFNQHFIRDIGMIYLAVAAGFVTGIVRMEMRTLLWGAASIWLAGHALFHFWEVAAGICGPDAIPRDFLGVTLPAILGLALTAWSYASGRDRASLHPIP